MRQIQASLLLITPYISYVHCYFKQEIFFMLLKLSVTASKILFLIYACTCFFLLIELRTCFTCYKFTSTVKRLIKRLFSSKKLPDKNT